MSTAGHFMSAFVIVNPRSGLALGHADQRNFMFVIFDSLKLRLGINKEERAFGKGKTILNISFVTCYI